MKKIITLLFMFTIIYSAPPLAYTGWAETNTLESRTEYEITGKRLMAAAAEPIYEESSSTNSVIMPIAIVVLLIIAIGATVYFIRSKK
ncbi:hypothetical protein [Jeotgalibacillus soli]|uniref:Gram-positive cocci surface proteins LPxTG domain-containing protein n=1 Tax=Jeotgalibacillus soli TaxID=889306 RepID=A0A0C2S6I7_9BACL|nr:hypothetical protein [Jeotgalibacillus soli]KIL49644.1 hypothetical protein KP78_11120 [Jeotgalibacillus soli]